MSDEITQPPDEWIVTDDGHGTITRQRVTHRAYLLSGFLEEHLGRQEACTRCGDADASTGGMFAAFQGEMNARAISATERPRFARPSMCARCGKSPRDLDDLGFCVECPPPAIEVWTRP